MTVKMLATGETLETTQEYGLRMIEHGLAAPVPVSEKAHDTERHAKKKVTPKGEDE